MIRLNTVMSICKLLFTVTVDLIIFLVILRSINILSNASEEWFSSYPRDRTQNIKFDRKNTSQYMSHWHIRCSTRWFTISVTVFIFINTSLSTRHLHFISTMKINLNHICQAASISYIPRAIDQFRFTNH